MTLADFVKNGKKIVGAGMNYKALLAEKKLPKPSEPFFFLKPTSSYIVEGQDVKVPAGAVVNEEVELGVIIGKSCKNVTVNEAMNYVGGYCLALDMTEANLVADSQKKGLPWTFGKGFDTACPVSRFVSVEELKDPSDVNIWLKVNGRKIQDANTSDLAFTIPELIASITRYITLEPGDLILTVPGIRAYEAAMHDKPSCADCGQEAHDTCVESTKFCINCKGSYSTWFRACPKWEAKKKERGIQFEKKISYDQAPRKESLSSSPPGIQPVQPGDVMEAGLGDILTINFPVKLA